MCPGYAVLSSELRRLPHSLNVMAEEIMPKGIREFLESEGGVPEEAQACVDSMLERGGQASLLELIRAMPDGPGADASDRVAKLWQIGQMVEWFAKTVCGDDAVVAKGHILWRRVCIMRVLTVSRDFVKEDGDGTKMGEALFVRSFRSMFAQMVHATQVIDKEVGTSQFADELIFWHGPMMQLAVGAKLKVCFACWGGREVRVHRLDRVDASSVPAGIFFSAIFRKKPSTRQGLKTSRPSCVSFVPPSCSTPIMGTYRQTRSGTGSYCSGGCTACELA